MASPSLCTICQQIPFQAFRYPTLSDLSAVLEDANSRDDLPPFKSMYTPSRIVGLLSELKDRTHRCRLCALIWQMIERRGVTDLQKGTSLDGKEFHVTFYRHAYGRFSFAKHENLAVRRLQVTLTVDGEDYSWYPEGYFDDCFQLCNVGALSVQVDGSFRDPRPDVDQMVFGGRRRPLVANLDWIREWIRICDTEECHQLCRDSEESDQFLVSSVRMIDTNRQCVVTMDSVKLDTVKYAALSYVWGASQKLKATSGNIEELQKPGALQDESVALTISDARELALKLGIEYIWVDALCILQDSDADKVVQISNMHAIYGAAYLTIVAAAGPDASAGLPGLRPNTRFFLQQEIVVIEPGSSEPGFRDGLSFMTTIYSNILSGGHYTDTTMWGRRGWTMQERALSRRALVFTSEQIYWGCMEAAFCEESYFELSEPRFRSFSSLGNELTVQRTFLNFGEVGDSSERTWSQYQILVRRFTQRQFSFEGDISDAFTGITRAFQRISGEQFHWGIPRSRFDIGMAWDTFTGQKRRAVLSTLPVTSKHGRVTFPSWSWMGWIGEVNVGVRKERLETENPNIRCHVHKSDPLTIEPVSQESVIDDPVTWDNVVSQLPSLAAGSLFEYPDEYVIFFWTDTATFTLRGGNPSTLYSTIKGNPDILDATGNVIGNTNQMLDEHWESGGYDNGTHEFALIARRAIDEIPDIMPMVLALQLERHSDGTCRRVNIGEINEKAWLAASPCRRLIALV
ncbi:HET-domain-containing protein [Trichodelitschia bisporula]|uniref:HET-domain-containing protein n=1 Tax=Trichodelitschia bisporula TaxID=703511 RepID=A0A6G1HUM0_9PEZI|nr:HET-domain-containing protein [Trichodelitschia bisporula]